MQAVVGYKPLRQCLRISTRAVHAKAEICVIGGGAAGLTAAYFAAQQGSKVTIIERTRECGKKILMSGGARCNVLPVEVYVQQDYFTESSKSALKAIFSTWTLNECKQWLEDKKQVGLHLSIEQESNKYFPSSNSSREVRDKLVAACQQKGVDIIYQACVNGLERDQQRGFWKCLYNNKYLTCDAVVVASGGLSFPKVGTDGLGLSLLNKLGHSIKDVYPALTPLTGPHPGNQLLQGVSLKACLNCKGNKGKRAHQYSQRQGFLFTHKGFSGPSVLDLSHFATIPMERGEPVQEIYVNWTCDDSYEWNSRLEIGGAMQVVTKLQQHGIPARLAQALCQEIHLDEKTQLAQLRKKDRLLLVNSLISYKLPITGHEGYKKAEVTGGGVPLNEIDAKTMQSRVLPGLYICGEVLDVFGRIGGFNFYWAWITGRLAGLSAAAQNNLP